MRRTARHRPCVQGGDGDIPLLLGRHGKDRVISFPSMGMACSTCGVQTMPQLMRTRLRYLPVAEKTIPGQMEMPD